MKKLLLLSSVAGLLIFAAGCKKDKVEDTNGGSNGGGGTAALVVENTQRGFVGYVGATWCPPCGSAGGPGYKAMLNKFSTDQMVSLYLAPSGETAPHYIKASDGKAYYAGFLQAFSGAMKSTGTIPYYNVNGANVGGAYTDANYTADRYGANITNLIANDPQIGVAAVKTLTADKLTCDVKIKAYEDYTGELFYSVLAIENSAVGLQKISGQPDNNSYEHRNIARASLVGDGTMEGQVAFDAVGSASIASGNEMTKSFSLTPPASYERGTNPVIPWKYTPGNTTIVVTLWSKVGDNYAYVNGVVAK